MNWKSGLCCIHPYSGHSPLRVCARPPPLALSSGPSKLPHPGCPSVTLPFAPSALSSNLPVCVRSADCHPQYFIYFLVCFSQ